MFSSNVANKCTLKAIRSPTIRITGSDYKVYDDGKFMHQANKENVMNTWRNPRVAYSYNYYLDESGVIERNNSSYKGVGNRFFETNPPIYAAKSYSGFLIETGNIPNRYDAEYELRDNRLLDYGSVSNNNMGFMPAPKAVYTFDLNPNLSKYAVSDKSLIAAFLWSDIPEVFFMILRITEPSKYICPSMRTTKFDVSIVCGKIYGHVYLDDLNDNPYISYTRDYISGNLIGPFRRTSFMPLRESIEANEEETEYKGVKIYQKYYHPDGSGKVVTSGEYNEYLSDLETLLDHLLYKNLTDMVMRYMY